MIAGSVAQGSAFVVTPEQYGAKADGVTDDSAAIVAAIQAAAALGCGAVEFQSGKSYRWPGTSGTVNPNGTNVTVAVTVTGVDGLSLYSNGKATIVDDTSYADAHGSTAIRFVGCDNLTLRGLRWESQHPDIVSGSNLTGLTPIEFVQGCDGITVDLDFDGCLYGIQAIKQSADPDSYRSTRITGRIKTKGTYYGALLGRSGNHSSLRIDSEDTGRTFFVYGTSDISLDTAVHNQVGASEIAAYGGDGCANIEVWMYDHDSDYVRANIAGIVLQYSDATPAVHENIKLHFDIKNKASGMGLLVTKAGATHALRGLEVDGAINLANTSGGDHRVIGSTGDAWTSDEAVSGINIHDLQCSGGNVELALGDALTDFAQVRNVSLTGGDFGITHTTGKTIFTGCAATTFTLSTEDTTPQEYHQCVGLSAGSQSFDPASKRFVDTTIVTSVFDGREVLVSIAQDAAFKLSTGWPTANLCAVVDITRDGGRSASFGLLSANHDIEERFIGAGYSSTKDTAAKANVYWDTNGYYLQNKLASGTVKFKIRYLVL